jgi:hypothetical protein
MGFVRLFYTMRACPNHENCQAVEVSVWSEQRLPW